MKLTKSFTIIIAVLAILVIPNFTQAQNSNGSHITSSNLKQKIKGRETTFYRDFFDQVIYYPISKPLRWDRIAKKLFGKKESLDINVFDEVPDSAFFTNRHGKKLMSIEELKTGPEGAGPAMDGSWTVTKGKSEGVSAGFFIRDAKGNKFLLKLDPADSPEMATSSEIIGHKFFHAFGYNVPHYTLVYFKPDRLTLDPKATYYNEEGFQKPLDREALQMLLKKSPVTKNGVFRASASTILKGSPKGFLTFEGREKNDPDDLILHEDRREIRALRVFASWLNHYDLRVGNSLDMVVEENGKTFVKHYMIDFGSLFGSAGSHVKYPAAVHENVIDWKAIGEALMIFRVEDKTWEKRWDMNDRQIQYPAIGYFDNLKFNPVAWRSQLPYEAFNRLTEADGYWAAKIIARFSDDMIRELVKTGEISDSEAENYLMKILTERRDMVVRYWFSKVAPIENLKLEPQSGNAYSLSFQDLAIEHGFEKNGQIRYRFRLNKNPWQEFSGNSISFALDPSKPKFILSIQKQNPQGSKWIKLPIRIHLERSNSGSHFQITAIERGKP